MDWTIIVASGDAAQRTLLTDAAGEVATKINPLRPPRVYAAPSVEDVRMLRARSRDPQSELIIITASLPETTSSPNLKDFPGFNFVAGLQKGSHAPACILVSEIPDHRQAVDLMPRCRFLSVGASTSYVEDCLKLAGQLGACTSAAAEPQDDPQIPYSLIDVFLRDKASLSTVALDVTYPKRERNTEQTYLDLKQPAVNKILSASRRLSDSLKALGTPHSYSGWQVAYRGLGECVHKLLFTPKLSGYYEYARGVAGNDVRLRFNLEPGVSDGLWEAICDPNTNEFLMMQSTITRRDSGATNQFASRSATPVGSLNVLVIGSPVVEGSVPEGLDGPVWKKHFACHPLKTLPHIGNDIAVLNGLAEAAAMPASTAAGIHVDVLGGDDIASLNREGKVWSLADIVKKELTDKPKEYDVIHFVGYTVFAPSTSKKGASAKPKKSGANTNQGYLIFSGYPAPRAVPIANVAKWVKATTVELVYLSCCRSSSGRAAAEFARNDVRMTIGFNWDLDNERTGRFTRIFYEELLKDGLKVCSAIRAAREKVKESEDQHPIWASSVLFAQPLKWPDVEGVLRPPNRKYVQSPPEKTEPPPMGQKKPPLSYKDKAILTKLLANWALRSNLTSDAYFKYLVQRSDFGEDLRLGGSGGYTGNINVDAQRIVDWAIGARTNPEDRNQALGTILLPLLGDDIGLEDRTFVAGLIVAYSLVQSDSDIEELRSRYQIPEQPVLGESVDLGPRVEWAKETLELQSWFAPDPGWLDVGIITTAAKRARSVCRVEVGETGATGTGMLIGRDLVLTNYHVLAGDLSADPKILEQRAPGTILRFGAFASEVTSANGQEVRLAGATPVVAFSKDNDFVLLRAAGSISQTINVVPFALLGGMPKTKEALNVLQHPEGGPMKLALSASGVTWVDPGGVKVQYTTKVAKGSSGSPCFDAKWNLIALHHAGSKSLGEGILMASVFDQIRQHLK
jgi:hypothetical protein